MFGKLKSGRDGAARALIDQANLARDERRFPVAAALYEEAIRTAPNRAGLHVQAGHMFKEAGDLASAERNYLAAQRMTPGDADLALQLGHFYKTAGHLRDAIGSYRRAAALAPEWPAPRDELAALRRAGLAGIEAAPDTDPDTVDPLDALALAMSSDLGAGLARAAPIEPLAPELQPLTASRLLSRHGESIHVRSLGRRERTRWGLLPVLRGVVALRGLCLSEEPLVELQLTLNGLPIARGPLESHPLVTESENRRLRKYVFNMWLDVSDFAYGVYDLRLRFVDGFGRIDGHDGRRALTERVVIAAPLDEADHPGSDNLVALTDPDDPRPVMTQVNARPSIVRAAKRSAFDRIPERVLVLRTDQLGDVVASVPALKRLRALLPHAKLVGLLTAANADLARSLGLLDEILVVDFPDDPIQRRRVMPLPEQEALRERLAGYAFDLALDLAPASESRPLLLLSGAKVTMGMGQHYDWLSTSLTIQSRDRLNGADFVPHSAKPLALVEALGAMLDSGAVPVRRADLGRDALADHGLDGEQRFAVMHTGARIAFSRWPHYAALAQRLLDATDLTVVMLADDPATRAKLPADLLASPRFVLIDRRLGFDALDALLSYCAVFVGNDSGPKHLASLRGVPVVSIHSARINWSEWAQELTGVVISRKVPCAGCLLYHEPEDCGAGYACIAHITIDEVLAAVLGQLGSAVATA